MNGGRASKYDLKIALATEIDSEAIGDLSRIEVEWGFPWRWTPEKVTQAIVDLHTNVAVARVRAYFAGFAIMRYDDATAHLQLLAVRPEFRRTGVGTAVMHWVEQVARTAGIESIQAEVRASNAQARAFYRELGYVETAVVAGMYNGIESGVRLEKRFNRV